MLTLNINMRSPLYKKNLLSSALKSIAGDIEKRQARSWWEKFAESVADREFLLKQKEKLKSVLDVFQVRGPAR